MKKYKVIKARKAVTDNPIKLIAGEKVLCIEESEVNEDWEGWILCKNSSNEGWVPKCILEIDGEYAVVLENYDATEFSIEEGEIIISERELNGWIWGHKEDKPQYEAWAPLNHLEIEE